MYEIIFGIGIVCFILAYLASNIDDKEHVFLKFILFFAVIFMLLFIPKINIDEKDNCKMMVENMTIYNASSLRNTTYGYQYSQVCNTDLTKNTTNFYVAYMWLIRFVALYLIVFVSYKVLNYVGSLISRKK